MADPTKTDMDELLRNKGAKGLVQLLQASEDLHVDPPTGPEEDVLELLERGGKGGGGPPLKTRRNAYHVLAHDTRWSGKLWFNTFTGQLMHGNRPHTDSDDVRISMWLDEQYQMDIAPKTIGEVVRVVAEEHQQNPVVTWLRTLRWDGIRRADSWLVHGVGADDTLLHRELARRWLIQAVARAMQPGCKADTVLILAGPQGLGKSTAFRVLGGEWYSDSPIEMGTINGYLQIRQAWIYEWSELDALRGRDLKQVKAFITSAVDRFANKYERYAQGIPRHTVFCGTTNEETFLGDPTGSRRFWPLTVRLVDLVWLAQHREQLWAEALADYDAGERWWLDQDGETSLRLVSDQFRHTDPWTEKIQGWLSEQVLTTTDVTTTRVMEGALKLEASQMHLPQQMRVGEILASLGWTRKRARRNNTLVYVYVRPEKPSVEP